MINKYINNNILEKRDAIFHHAKAYLKDCQPWPTHFELRKIEYDLLNSFIPIKTGQVILDIGCGNAFVAALSSVGAKLVVGCDLPSVDKTTHSIGMGKALKLIKSLQIPNIALVSSTAASLPLKANSIDFVITLYTLEHIADRGTVIKEIARVLKTNGMCIFVVPNFMERFYSVIPYYFNMIITVIQFFKKYLRLSLSIKKHNSYNRAQSHISSFDDELKIPLRQKMAGFLQKKMFFPMPHGEYNSWLDELLTHLPNNWKHLLSRNRLNPIAIFSTIIIPLPLLQLFSPQFAAWFYEKSSAITRTIGGMPIIRSLGFNIVFAMQKSHKTIH